MSPLVGAHTAPGGLWAGEAWEEDMQGGGLVHQWCLAGWGKPRTLSPLSYTLTLLGVMIGEMWDLECLCDKCEQLQRYTCFVSSVPLKVRPSPPSLCSHPIPPHPGRLTCTQGPWRRRQPAERCGNLLEAPGPPSNGPRFPMEEPLGTSL